MLIIHISNVQNNRTFIYPLDNFKLDTMLPFQVYFYNMCNFITIFKIHFNAKIVEMHMLDAQNIFHIDFLVY